MPVNGRVSLKNSRLLKKYQSFEAIPSIFKCGIITCDHCPPTIRARGVNILIYSQMNKNNVTRGRGRAENGDLRDE